MNSNNNIDVKIVKVLNGTASDSERQEVLVWAGESKKNEFQLEKLKKFWNQTSLDKNLIGHEDQKKKIWKAFTEENHIYRSRYENPFYKQTWFRVAAILTLILLSFHLLFNTAEDITMDAVPQWEVIVKKNPSGQKSLIQLPDGSKVWLNSDSQISYDERFSDSTRSIRLEGEAYFEVVRDSLRPFKVEFGTLSVTVLGTQFNINAFEEEKNIKVTLIDGSVKVSPINSSFDKDLVLSPGTGIIYSKENNKINEFSWSSNPDLFSKAADWRTGILVFDGNDFEEFVREIARWYGIQVHIEGNPPSDWKIMASFENELLTNVMDAVSYNKGFRYNLKDKELKIMFN